MVSHEKMISHATEDYLKAIYELEEDFGRVSTSALAERLAGAPVSAPGTLPQLSARRAPPPPPRRPDPHQTRPGGPSTPALPLQRPSRPGGARAARARRRSGPA